LPDRRAIRGGGTNREASANPAGAPRSRAREGRRQVTLPTDEVPVLADSADTSGQRTGQRRRPKRDVNGWLVLDKPVGMTSTHAVSVVKRLFAAKRAGHAGTLDPLASGLLPIALGEATKTVPFVMEGRKTYLFTVRWGEERDTDDAEGRVMAS